MWMGFDSLINFFSGLGIPGRDKRTGTQFEFTPLTEEELESMYRDSWLAGKIVDCPADDATREWRDWQAKPNQIENIEAIEKSFDVRRKMRDAMVLARLFGGSALVMGVDGQGDSTQFLDVEKVKKGQLKFLHVAAPKALGTGPIITDVMNPFYGYPEYFSRNIGGTVGRPAVSTSPLPTSELIRTAPSRSGNIGDMYRIHPSRVILFRGKGLPDPTIWSSGGPWGDSILQRINESINDASSIFANAAVLVNEAKFDVVKIPGLNQKIINEEYQKKLTARFMYANVSKSTINTIVLDKDEEWTRITQDFGALPEMMRMFTLIVSGAADIPVTRLLGQSPAGLSATGESDIRNYYDRVAADQENDLTPTINRLDEVLIRTALGDRDPSIYYEWTPLWQMSEEEKADVALKKAQAFKIDHDAGLIDPEALRIGRQNQLIEDGVYPGLEQALEEQQLLELESMKTPEEQDTEAEANVTEIPAATTNVVPIKKAVGDYNPNHEPAGSPEGGEFASAGGSYSEDEKAALKDYAVTSYVQINTAAINGEHHPLIEKLDSAIQKSTLSADKTLYRGLVLPDAESIGIGDVINYKGFSSTSTTDAVPLRRAKFSALNTGKDAVILTILAKAGQHAADVSKSGYDSSEKEFLLPRDTKFVVTKAKTSKGVRNLEVTIG
jgi:phage-related protein (TIGR01555 family)